MSNLWSENKKRSLISLPSIVGDKLHSSQVLSNTNSPELVTVDVQSPFSSFCIAKIYLTGQKMETFNLKKGCDYTQKDVNFLVLRRRLKIFVTSNYQSS